MADTITTPAVALPDPVQLHMRAVNLLNRCKTLILSEDPMYCVALQALDEARKTLSQLATIDSNLAV